MQSKSSSQNYLQFLNTDKQKPKKYLIYANRRHVNSHSQGTYGMKKGSYTSNSDAAHVVRLQKVFLMRTPVEFDRFKEIKN